MLLECANCGAPLDVGMEARRTKCKYCGVISDADRMRTLAAQTPRNWSPPKVWTPPAHVPASSTVALRYKGGGAVLSIVMAMVGVSVAMGVIGVFLGTKPMRGGAMSAPLSTGLSPSALAKITLREPRTYFASLPGAAAWSDDGIRVPLAGDTWNAVTFQWDPQHPEHVLSFFLNCPSPNPAFGRVRGKLEQLLPKRFDGDSWQTEGAGFYFAPAGGVLSVHVTKEKENALSENQIWRQQVEALWDVVRAAALDLPVKPDPAAVRDYLGGGYPLTKLLELDMETTVEASDAAVRRVFPGAQRQKHIDLEYTVAVAHPWLGTAELQWGNKEGAKLKEVSLRSPGHAGKLAHQDDFIACVTTGLGVQGKVNVSDYLAKNKDVTFNPKEGGEIRIYSHMIMITLKDSPFSKPMTRPAWEKSVRVLDACGRGK